MPIAPIVATDAASGPRGSYTKTAATRARILDAAIEVFGGSGFEAGSLRAVAGRAGISQAGLLHHFPSKVALLSAVLERRDERAVELVLAHEPGVRQLDAIIGLARDSAESPGEIGLFTVLSAEATRESHPANSYMRRRYAWVSERLEVAFAAASAAGQLRSSVGPRRLANELMALWDGLQLQWLLKLDGVDVADGLEHFVDLHLVRPLRELVDGTL